MSEFEFKSHDPIRQATSDRFHKGLLDGHRDRERQAARPPLEPIGMNPEYASSSMYQTGYRYGLTQMADTQRT